MNLQQKIGNLPCKPTNKIRQNREASLLPAKSTSQRYKHSNKIQCRNELQISAKAKKSN